ncbi:MAG: ABC transporter permease [Candidatus Aenigmatarchaeota archaeon]
MKFNDIIRLSINNLSHRGLRSWLTILGIVIGVAAVVAILSIGAGMQHIISTQLSGLGADIVTVSPGYSRAVGMNFGVDMRQTRLQSTQKTQDLTDRDIQVIKSVPGVKFVNGIVSGRANITYMAQSTLVTLQGVNPLTWKEMSIPELDSGRYLMPGDGNVVVVGYRIANNMFKQPILINTQISISGKSFRVVGILKESGGFGGVSGYDNTIFMPTNVARTIINISTNQFSSIQIKVADPESVNEITANIEQSLMLSRRVTENTKDFTIISAQAIHETISNVMGTMSLFLAGIAAVSLIVGAIGIANTMFMSVMERTRQIGTLKALGATNFEIMKLFLFESATIGLIGGLIGVFLGFIASGIISELGIRIMEAGRMRISITLITPELVLFAIAFSVLIGMVSGILPARRAAQLQPVEALRYE